MAEKETNMINHIERKDWIRAFTAHPAANIIQLSQLLSQDAEVSMMQLPQAGLGLVKFKESAFNEHFYLGEIPLSSCSIKLHYPNGQEGSGSVQVMADDAALAQALAILDAVLAHQLPNWQQACEYLQEGMQKRQQLDQQRQQILIKTRVDFSTLDKAEH